MSHSKSTGLSVRAPRPLADLDEVHTGDPLRPDSRLGNLAVLWFKITSTRILYKTSAGAPTRYWSDRGDTN